MAFGRKRRRSTRRPWYLERRLVIPLLLLVILVPAGLFISLLLTRGRTRTTPTFAEVPVETAALAVRGYLFDEGLSHASLTSSTDGQERHLSCVVDPVFPLDKVGKTLPPLLVPLHYRLTESRESGAGETGALTLVFRPEGPADRGRITVTFSRRHHPPDLGADQTYSGPPRLALVIDDLGRQGAYAAELAALPVPLTFSIMPRQPLSRKGAALAAAAGKEVLLHLPMEPLDSPDRDPGPGSLISAMSPEEVTRVLDEDLRTVPGAVGVNNHMGSRLTADGPAMDILMTALRKRKLFFLDSRTSPNSVAIQKARQKGVRSVGRDVFLDNADDPELIREQMDELIRICLRHGTAVGIGHPKGHTLAAIKEGLARIEEAGIDVVPLSELVR